MSQKKTAVVLVNMGGPESLDETIPYLKNIFLDRDLIRMPLGPLRPFFATWIAHKRSATLQKIYQQIGGGSPLGKISLVQAEQLQTLLREQIDAVQVVVAMRYWKPDMDSVWKQLKDENIQRILMVPLYPFFSIPSTGSILKRGAWLSQRDGFEHQVMDRFGNRPEFVQIIATQIREVLDRKRHSYDALVLSAHSLPLKTIRKQGDPYAQEVESCAEELRDLFRDELPIHLAYQSKVGPVEWLGPSTRDMIASLSQQGIKSLLVYPMGFVADNSETLYEIAIECRQWALDCGVTHFEMVSAFNDRWDFSHALAQWITDKFRELHW